MLFVALFVVWLALAILAEVSREGARGRARPNARIVPLRVEVPQSVDFVWTEAVRLIDAQLDLSSSLDGKISPLIAVSGAALALVVGQRDLFGGLTPILALELLVVIAFLLLAFRFRGFAFAPALSALLAEANRAEDEIKTLFLGNMQEAYLINVEALSVKNLYLRWATYSLGFIAATLVIVAIR